ncbi:hypothetical protein BC835DRAFT_1317357 [Cytidiella melzeri]|nr:hypothetical protein BC835DRAFT_1317357 [Cytidiella melzeri]
MESLSHRRQDEQRKQAELRRQIAALQAQLKDDPTNLTGSNVPTTPKKRKQQDHTLLAPETPSPKKHRASKEFLGRHTPNRRSNTAARPTSRPQTNSTRPSHPFTDKPSQPPAPSTVLAKLASLTSSHAIDNPDHTASRSSGFLDSAPMKPVEGEDASSSRALRRNDDLTLIEDLAAGPYEHKASFDDPNFQKIEPHSGIRLSSRTIPYGDFQDYLRGRYYLSPSLLYSVIRLLPSKQGYDVPVEGDWVTIAVIAERGPMRYSKAPVGIGKEDAEGLPEDDVKSLSLDAPPKPEPPKYPRWKGKAKEEPPKPSGKRYVNLKLIDFGCRSKSSATAEKAVIRGDAFLSLLLFESDSVEEITQADGRKEKLYKGGSRGAFERMAKLKEGAVIALLNPKILRPFQRAGDKPHPTDNILALTPETIDSVAVIGQSQDLGMCTVVKRDGKVCGGWCDKRLSDVCEWHIQHAVQRKRAGRAEFSVGTSGMSTAPKRKPVYDPAKQWGLKPEPDRGREAGETTYMVSGHIVSNGAGKQTMFVGENMGRDAQAKAARKASSKDADRALQNLLKRDKEGMKAVAAAREHGKKMSELMEKEKGGQKKGKKGKSKDTDSGKSQEPASDESNDGVQTSKSVYSVDLIRSIGFDPTGKDGRKTATKDVQNKLDTLASIQEARKEIRLGPRPGKLKSTVRAPDKAKTPTVAASTAMSNDENRLLPSDDSDDELEREIVRFGHRPTTAMVNLDSSDVELEIELSS